MYCRNCGKEIDAESRFCPFCGFTTGEDACPGPESCPPRNGPTVVYNEKSEFLAILLSFLITGVGHMYVGKTANGVKLLILQVLIAVLTVVATMISPVLSLIYLASLALWFYAMYDAYRECKAYNAGLRDYGYPPW